MVVTFWGARGSIPVCGTEYVRYGGETSCISVEIGGKLVVVDAGTGIRRLGLSGVVDRYDEIYLVFTHCHMDHVRGLPFFAPLFDEAKTVYLLSNNRTLPMNPFDLINGILFPREMRDIPANVVELHDPVSEVFESRGLDVQAIEANHPGGAVGFDFRDSKRFIHMPDNEISQPAFGVDHFAELFGGADVLCHDAQYTKEEYAAHPSWGHSCVDDVVKVALAAGVKSVLLCHHDPQRTDDQIDGLVFDWQLKLLAKEISIEAVRTGMRLKL